jgi:hypothetical protein
MQTFLLVYGGYPLVAALGGVRGDYAFGREEVVMLQFIRRAYERWEGSEITLAFGWLMTFVFVVMMVTKIITRIEGM